MSGTAYYLIFQGRASGAGAWRFRLVASNGEAVGPASQGFRDQTDAERGARANANAALQAAGRTPLKEGADIKFRYL